MRQEVKHWSIARVAARTLPAAHSPEPGVARSHQKQGPFCALYSDRAAHFFYTPRKGAVIDADRLTQVGRAMRWLGIRMSPAYSPQGPGSL
jgi:hypothetical protein